LAAVIGAVGLPVGGCDGSKSDGQIQASPEAANAAQAVAKSYGEQMVKKYAGQMKTKKH
jgi:hypothetical protein